jgi:hypothetical protein
MAVSPIFIILIIFGSITFIIVYIKQTNHEFKMKLLEKGLTSDQYKELFTKNMGMRQMFTINPLRNLQVGILALFVGIGLMIGQALDRIYNYESFIPTSMLISCGCGLIFFYFISKKKVNKE